MGLDLGRPEIYESRRKAEGGLSHYHAGTVCMVYHMYHSVSVYEIMHLLQSKLQVPVFYIGVGIPSQDTGRCSCLSNVGDEDDDKCCMCTHGFFNFSPLTGCEGIHCTKICNGIDIEDPQ